MAMARSQRIVACSSLALSALLFSGTVCTTTSDTIPRTYEAGREQGFKLDEWYWDGFFDSFDTVDFEPIFYDDSEIPFLEGRTFEAGFWEGVWIAYNDGYFTDYRYAFFVGFSEGYDNAFWPDYLDFLASDVHVEYLNGGWADGYDDGFSEGRVFGAFDFEADLPFDWEDAIRDYQSGTDLFFEEVGVGTGDFGPVVLYEWGANPHFLKEAAPRRASNRQGTPSIRIKRSNSKERTLDLESLDVFRPVREDAQQELDVTPSISQRSERELRLNTSWLDRIQAVQNPADTKS